MESVTRHRAVGYSRAVVACAAALGLAAGFSAGRRSTDRTRGVDAASAADAPVSLDDWIARATAAPETPLSPQLRTDLVRALTASEALRGQVIERFARESRRPHRAATRELLAATGAPDVAAAAKRLASAADGLSRAAGFELLGAMPPTAESFALARRAVEIEADPVPLAGELVALQPPSPPSQADTTALLPRLIELARHTDALVRAHAVQRVAEWDKRGDDATPLVLRGLDDEAPIVRQAAVGAVMLGRLGSDDVKRALLRRLEAPGEEPVVQGAALFALQRFALSDAEQTVFLARRRELERRVPR